MILLLIVVITIISIIVGFYAIKRHREKKKFEPFKLSNPQKMPITPISFSEVNYMPVVNPFSRWPRNLSCFCGSGVKFKKCHQGKIAAGVKQDQAKGLERDYKKVLAHVEGLQERGHIFKHNKPVL